MAPLCHLIVLCPFGGSSEVVGGSIGLTKAQLQPLTKHLGRGKITRLSGFAGAALVYDCSVADMGSFLMCFGVGRFNFTANANRVLAQDTISYFNHNPIRSLAHLH